jgi:ribosomal protein S18 acetylase RimI-like enzyme
MCSTQRSTELRWHGALWDRTLARPRRLKLGRRSRLICLLSLAAFPAFQRLERTSFVEAPKCVARTMTTLAAEGLPAPAYCLRQADFARDMHDIRALHAHLEVAYDDAYYDCLSTEDSMLTLVVEVEEAADVARGLAPRHAMPEGRQAAASCYSPPLVGVITARVDSDDEHWPLFAWVRDIVSTAGAALRHLVGKPLAPSSAALVNEARKDGYIMTLVVAPGHRQRGLAGRLLEAACAILRVRYNCGSSSLHCLASNFAARRLYARHGYTELALLASYYDFGGRTHDGVHLKRAFLAAPPFQLAPGDTMLQAASASASWVAPPCGAVQLVDGSALEAGAGAAELLAVSEGRSAARLRLAAGVGSGGSTAGRSRGASPVLRSRDGSPLRGAAPGAELTSAGTAAAPLRREGPVGEDEAKERERQGCCPRWQAAAQVHGWKYATWQAVLSPTRAQLAVLRGGSGSWLSTAPAPRHPVTKHPHRAEGDVVIRVPPQLVL